MPACATNEKWPEVRPSERQNELSKAGALLSAIYGQIVGNRKRSWYPVGRNIAGIFIRFAVHGAF
jgi:hypothetical protein